VFILRMTANLRVKVPKFKPQIRSPICGAFEPY